MPGDALPEPVRVAVRNGGLPVTDAPVRFRCPAGELALDGPPTGAPPPAAPVSVEAVTGADGVARVFWRLDPGGATTQTLIAQRLDDRLDPTDVRVTVNARLSVASQVQWEPRARASPTPARCRTRWGSWPPPASCGCSAVTGSTSRGPATSCRGRYASSSTARAGRWRGCRSWRWRAARRVSSRRPRRALRLRRRCPGHRRRPMPASRPARTASRPSSGSPPSATGRRTYSTSR